MASITVIKILLNYIRKLVCDVDIGLSKQASLKKIVDANGIL